MNKQLKSTRSDKLDDIIHNIKTPITIILGYCDLAIMKHETLNHEQVLKIKELTLKINSLLSDIRNVK